MVQESALPAIEFTHDGHGETLLGCILVDLTDPAGHFRESTFCQDVCGLLDEGDKGGVLPVRHPSPTRDGGFARRLLRDRILGTFFSVIQEKNEFDDSFIFSVISTYLRIAGQ